MTVFNEYDEYMLELREQVCSRCIERQTGAPPCAPLGKQCGIEHHLPKLVEICRATNNVLMAPYSENLHEQICSDCVFKEEPTCPCPLRYLLQLAVEAVETVERRRATMQATRLAPNCLLPLPTAANQVPSKFGYDI